MRHHTLMGGYQLDICLMICAGKYRLEHAHQRCAQICGTHFYRLEHGNIGTLEHGNIGLLWIYNMEIFWRRCTNWKSTLMEFIQVILVLNCTEATIFYLRIDAH